MLTPKVATGALAGAVSVIVVWIITKCGVEVPAEIASAFTTIISAGSSYFAPRSDPTPEQVVDILQKNEMQQQQNYNTPTTPL